jgi:hypothetical protein
VPKQKWRRAPNVKRQDAACGRSGKHRQEAPSLHQGKRPSSRRSRVRRLDRRCGSIHRQLLRWATRTSRRLVVGGRWSYSPAGCRALWGRKGKRFRCATSSSKSFSQVTAVLVLIEFAIPLKKKINTTYIFIVTNSTW